MKRPKKRGLCVRATARNDYVKLLNAIGRFRGGERLLPAEESLVRIICEDVARGLDPTVRFFDPAEGQSSPTRQLWITIDYLTAGDNKIKDVSKRWKLSTRTVQNIAGRQRHKTLALKLIEGMNREEVRAFVEQMLTVYSTTRE